MTSIRLYSYGNMLSDKKDRLNNSYHKHNHDLRAHKHRKKIQKDHHKYLVSAKATKEKALHNFQLKHS